MTALYKLLCSLQMAVVQSRHCVRLTSVSSYYKMAVLPLWTPVTASNYRRGSIGTNFAGKSLVARNLLHTQNQGQQIHKPFPCWV